MRNRQSGRAILWILAVAGVLVLLGLWAASLYNGFVGRQESVRQQWANVQGAYQRRMDLVPNLVETVKGASDFERETLTQVIDARSRATQVTISPDALPGAASLEAFQKSQGELSSALGRLLVVVERYPELKANQNYLDLQSQLEGTENRINVERNRYNEVAQEFNRSVRSFPGNMIASLFGFEPAAYFTAEEGAAQAPKVVF